MFATASFTRRPVSDALGALRAMRFTRALSPWRVPSTEDEDPANDHRMMLRTLDELGLLSGEGCSTERGLLELAAGLLLVAIGVLVTTDQLTRLNGYFSFLNEVVAAAEQALL